MCLASGMPKMRDCLKRAMIGCRKHGIMLVRVYAFTVLLSDKKFENRRSTLNGHTSRNCKYLYVFYMLN